MSVAWLVVESFSTTAGPATAWPIQARCTAEPGAHQPTTRFGWLAWDGSRRPLSAVPACELGRAIGCVAVMSVPSPEGA